MTVGRGLLVPMPAVDEMSYEQARDELVTVVSRLEAGDETLEGSLALWERGEALASRCQQWLDGARARLDAARSGAAQSLAAADLTEPGTAPSSTASSSTAPSSTARPEHAASAYDDADRAVDTEDQDI